MDRSKLNLPGSDYKQVPARRKKRRRLRAHRAGDGHVAGRSVTWPLSGVPGPYGDTEAIDPSGEGALPARPE